MFLIEPCCSQKNLRELRYTIKDGGTAQFEGYGDLSLADLMGPLVNRYNGTEMVIVAPSLPDQAAEVIDKWMRLTWARMDGQGSIWRIERLTIVADLSREKSPVASTWLKDKPFGDRLTLVDIEQEDTAILLPDFAITGPVNMRYGHHFTATATTEPEKVKALWEKYRSPTPTLPSREGTNEAHETHEPKKKKKSKKAKTK